MSSLLGVYPPPRLVSEGVHDCAKISVGLAGGNQTHVATTSINCCPNGYLDFSQRSIQAGGELHGHQRSLQFTHTSVAYLEFRRGLKVILIVIVALVLPVGTPYRCQPSFFVSNASVSSYPDAAVKTEDTVKITLSPKLDAKPAGVKVR